MPVLADTSAWIEYDLATGSRVDERMLELTDSARDLVVTDPVLMEVLAGARGDLRERQLRGLLRNYGWVACESDDFESAQRIYRRCRGVGVTPRGLVDCLIAAIALRAGCSVLAHDIDLARLAGVVGVELDPASLGA